MAGYYDEENSSLRRINLKREGEIAKDIQNIKDQAVNEFTMNQEKAAIEENNLNNKVKNVVEKAYMRGADDGLGSLEKIAQQESQIIDRSKMQGTQGSDPITEKNMMIAQAIEDGAIDEADALEIIKDPEVAPQIKELLAGSISGSEKGLGVF